MRWLWLHTGRWNLVPMRAGWRAIWLVPLWISSPSLYAVPWNNGANISNGNVAGISYTPVVGTTTLSPDGVLSVTSPNPSDPGQVGFTLPGSTAGWVRFNGNITSGARFELTEVYVVASPTLGGLGQGSYTVVPADQKVPVPTSPIVSNLSSFTISGGAISQVPASGTGPTVSTARLQNLLLWQPAGFTSHTTVGGANSNGLNPFSVGTPAAGVTAWNTKNEVDLLVYPTGTTTQSLTGQFLMVGQGTAIINGDGVAALSSALAHGYQLYRRASAGTITSGTIALASGEVAELQGGLVVSGGLTNAGPNPAVLLMGGHGDSAASVQFSATATVAPSFVIQDDPARTFPFGVNTGITGTITSPQFVMMEGSNVLIGSGVVLTPTNLTLHGGGTLTTSTGSTLTVSGTTTLGGSIVGASTQTLTLGNVNATLSSSSITAPSGTVATGTVTVQPSAGLSVLATGGTITASGLVNPLPSSGGAAAATLSMQADTINWTGSASIQGLTNLTGKTAITLSGSTNVNSGASLNVQGDAPVTVATLTSTLSETGNFNKVSGAGITNVTNVSVPGGAILNVGANGSAAMNLGTAAITLTGSLNVSGTANVTLGPLTANGSSSLLSVSGTGTRTFSAGVISITAGNSLTLQSIAPTTFTVPTATLITFWGAGTLSLQGPVTLQPALTFGASPQNLGLLGGGPVVETATFTGGVLSVSNSNNLIQSMTVNSPLIVSGTGEVTLGSVGGASSVTAASATIILNQGSVVNLPAGQGITANTLRLAGNPSLSAGVQLIGSPTLEIAGNLNQNLAAVTINGGQINFTGTSRLQGSGTLIATGTTGTGDITAIAPAAVSMQGMNLQAKRNVEIQQGASLGGVGVIRVGDGGTGTLTADGTLVAGAPVGTLTVQGPVQFKPTGGFAAGINGAGVGLLDVVTGPSGAGVATLAGNLSVTLTGIKPRIGTSYTVIEAESVVGTFNQVGGSAGILTFSALYTPTTVEVVVSLPPGGICSLPTPCSAAQAVACALDEVIAQSCWSPCFEDFLYDHVFYPSDNINVVLQELAGGPFTDLPQVAGLQLVINQDVVRSQQWLLLDRWASGSQTQLWLDPTGDAITSTGWRLQAGGAQAGVAHTWSSGVGFGVAATVEAVRMRSRTFSLHGHGLNVLVTPLLSYVPSWRSGFWRSYVNASLSAGGLVTSLERNISWAGFCCQANSHWNPMELSGRLEAGLAYRDCGIAFQPFAALSGFKVAAGSIHEESNCCAGLDMSCWYEGFGFLEGGFRWRNSLCAMNTTFAPELDLGTFVVWGRGSEMTAQFQEACCASWDLCGPALSRWGAFGGFGLQASASDRLTIGMRLDGRFASAYRIWSATAQATWIF